MKVVHLTVKGRVQGVGYRAWCAREAEARGLAGWVRNRRTGAVEAVFAGSARDVDAMAQMCRQGPPGSRVDDIVCHEASETALAACRGTQGFVVLETL
ncbi:acylphosphatase [Aquabacter spiritensis]|uniref:acylphosphatase n=1 Tax=Aquabacter spiritensis TaxID=933073 RepID=A0A4R3LL01_9HYPH|nr:acylphosphatase [Aquabacter spiritensis]TCT00972.1 acylphosphatase [Aquabacter spiritensis]